ncbi:MAG: hypothetical protein JWO44_1350 [Bacteroidetes bacterium]|nr:hypothetical protein [Bacteroidota bacterium]
MSFVFYALTALNCANKALLKTPLTNSFRERAKANRQAYLCTMSGFTKITFIFLFSAVAALMLPSCKSRGAHNEYREAKVRVSEREMAKDKKVLRKGKKAYQKQMRRNRKHLFGRARAPKE